MFPICTTEKDGFQRFIATLDPRYDIPSAKYMSGTAIPALYEKTREQVASDIMEPYLSYSIHFIDDNWILQTKCLQTLFVQKDHTADNLCEVMTETLTQWKLEMDRQVCITTDNGSNITCAATSRLALNPVMAIVRTLLILSWLSVLLSKVHQVVLEFQLLPSTKKTVYVSL